jgi:AhpD family alkylhydroperoxidase
MARVPLVPDEDPDATAAGVFDTFKAEGRPPIDLYRALANVPSLLVAYRALPQMLRHRATTERRLRELAVLRVAQLTGSAYEWGHHRPMAIAAGVTERQIGELARWDSSQEFGAAERLVLAAVEAVHEVAVTDELFGQLAGELGQEGAVEIIAIASQYEAAARIIQALGIAVEERYRPQLADWPG